MSCKSSLFLILEEEVGPLGERAKQLVATLGMIPLARFVPSSKGWIGRPSRTATPSHARLGQSRVRVYDPIAALHCFLAG